MATIKTTVHFSDKTNVEISTLVSSAGPFTLINFGQGCDIIIRDEYRPKLQELADKLAAHLAKQAEVA